MNLDAWFAVVGDVVVRSTAVLIVAACLAAALRKSSAAARHNVWLLALLGVLAMPLLTATLPAWRALPVPRGESQGAAPTVTDVVAPEASPLPEVRDEVASLPQPTMSATPSPAAAPVVSRYGWRSIASLIWFIGVIVMIVPPLLGAMSLRRLGRWARHVKDDSLLLELSKQLGLRRPPVLLTSAERDMPMTWGVFSARLLLPAGFERWSDDRRRAVMLHELAHVARRDCLWQWVGHMARAVYWFHPLVWLAVRQIARERERACDDLVLCAGGGSGAADYAEHLLQIASNLQPPAFAAHAAIAMARRSNLERRIVAILDPRTDRRRLTIAGVIVVALLGMLVPPLAMLRAAAPAPPTTKLVVQTVDAADKPVAGVDVYVFHELYPSKDESNVTTLRLGPIKSDAGGAATIEVPQPAVWTNTSVFARVPGKMIGVSIAQDLAKPSRILMVSAEPMKGSVTVPAGFKVRDVKVSLLTMMVNDGTVSSQMISPGHDKWPELFEYRVAEDGTFTVPEVPLKGGAYVAGNAKGLGEAQFMSTATGPTAGAKLEMRKEGVIEGTLTREGDNSPAAGVKIFARPDHRSGLVVTHPYIGMTDAKGKFRIDGLPEAIYTITNGLVETVPEWVMPSRDDVLVKAGATVADVKLQLERGTLVVGQVTDSQGGGGVKGAHVTALYPASKPNPEAIASSETDAEGRYVLRLPAGTSKLYFAGLPDGYSYPSERDGQRTIEVAKGEANKEGPSFVLSKPVAPPEAPGIAILGGRVVDASGKGVQGVPIADYRIEKWSGGDMPVQDPRAATTDADGRFEFKATGGLKHTLSVSDVRWQHEKTKEFVPKKDETFTHPDIVIRERRVLGTITGIVVDPDGKPIEGVQVGHQSPSRTDANGRFSMEVRDHGQPMAQVMLGKTGYASRNWNDVPPDAKDAKFVLFPSSRAGFNYTGKDPPPPKDAIGKPAPKLDVAQWVHSSTGNPPAIGAGGKKTFVLLDWNSSEPADVRKSLDQLAAEAAKANAEAVVIYSPQSHELGVRAMLGGGGGKPNVFVGIDRFVVDSEYYVSGATMAKWGLGRMPHAFVVDEQGVVRHEQRGVAKLAEAAKKN